MPSGYLLSNDDDLEANAKVWETSEDTYLYVSNCSYNFIIYMNMGFNL